MTSSLALHKHLLSDVIKRLSGFASRALSTLSAFVFRFFMLIFSSLVPSLCTEKNELVILIILFNLNVSTDLN